MKMQYKTLLLWGLLIFSPFMAVSPAQAKVFRNAYVAFELPDTWQCALEVTEWVCRSQVTNDSKEAIIILTAKEVGPTDTFQIYQTTLDQERMVPTRSGSQVKSKVVYKSKEVIINNHKWIDGLQLGSEIPNYFTRYVATIKDQIAILVTFSAHRQHYTKYSKDFFKAIMSLQVIASKGLIQKPDTSNLKGGEILGAGDGLGINSDVAAMDYPGERRRKGGKSNQLLLIGLGTLLAAAGGFLYWRSRR